MYTPDEFRNIHAVVFRRQILNQSKYYLINFTKMPKTENFQGEFDIIVDLTSKVFHVKLIMYFSVAV